MSQTLSALFLLGGSFPEDQHIEDALRPRLAFPSLGFQDLLDRHDGGRYRKALKPRMAVLAAALQGRAPGSVLLIGRSSGAITATLTASLGAPAIRGVVALGYPFRHPERDEEPARTAHLAGLQVPLLILQGARDAYGNAAAATRYPLSAAIRVEELAGVGHRVHLPPQRWDRIATRITRFARQLQATEDQGAITSHAANMSAMTRLSVAGRTKSS